ncbi:MAG: pyruvate formate lyase family protein [Promethearchaeota archaeon]
MFKLVLKLAKWKLKKPEFKKEIYNEETGHVWNARIHFTTEDGKDNLYVIFENGNMEIGSKPLEDPTIKLIFKNSKVLSKIYRISPQDTMVLLLNNHFRYKGNLTDIARFSFLTGSLLQGRKRKFQKRQAKKVKKNLLSYDEFLDWDNGSLKYRPIKSKLLNQKVDNVKFLEDPYLGKYKIQDFKRINYLKYRHFQTPGTVCTERAKLLTDFFRKNGFLKEDGNEDHPGLRQGKMINHVLSNKKPIIQDYDLLAGTTTTKEKGVLLYPDTGAVALWPELYTIDNRDLNPYEISQEGIDILNYEVFPYWSDRNIREYCRTMTGNPLSQQLDEVWILYFMWKTQTISHTIPGFPSVLESGLEKTMNEVINKKNSTSDKKKQDFYEGLRLAIQGVINYATNLSKEAQKLADSIDINKSSDSQKQRKKELENLSRICAKVPAKPADSFEEAINSIWITWIALHHESMNAGLSLGRLDQWLQPYFEADMQKATSEQEKEAVIRKTIELMGCFFLRTGDHLPLVPDIGNYLFGGSSSDQALTVGGVDENGENAVNDMTYIILKVTEMLCLRDPNMNARYHPEKNSKEYLDRLCEVNINTAATPSIHNDKQVIKALTIQGIPIEHARTWAATGCVEPTICGKHFGHTNCMMLNSVAALEMTLNDGCHPVISNTWQVGPSTGRLNEFKTYQDFLNAYKTQLHFLIDNSVEYNNNLGRTHQILHPTPLLSSLIEGPLDKGKDLVDGAAVYNTSGVAIVGLTDVIDSLKVIKDLVYDRKIIDFPTFNDVIKVNFETKLGNDIYKEIEKLELFGSDDAESNEIGKDLVNFIYEDFLSYQNYRGGRYMAGFWSMSNHVAFGTLSGALPNGRKAFKSFTPGLTPAPGRKDQLIQNIHSVASLDSLKMPNNLAFNVKLVPNSSDSHDETLNYFNSYVKSYCDLGGMQIQFNVITSDLLRDAMNHPEDYGWLIVRISGYNAYFTDLNRDMQLELIERHEFVSH